ncbi:hypothetical protein PspLS_05952 [Pyricularia sp. CBS 133598]|nr:hypothetical protein PspLS_05952 [Pyricularia sp. CBS 133598]
MTLRSWAWNTSRSVRNYSKKSIPQNVEAGRTNYPDAFFEKDTHPEDNQELDDVFLNLARMRIQPQVDPAAKKVSTSAGDLPLSPLMNPEFLAARRKYAQPKAKVDTSKHGKMEKQLARNPYAWALAGPVRFDPSTQRVLPRFFLQDFAYVSHPETMKPWMVPVSLMSEGDKKAAAEEAACDTDQPDGAFTSYPSRHCYDEDVDYNLSAVRKGKPRGLPRPSSPTSYILCRRDVLKGIAVTNNDHNKAPREAKPMIYRAFKGRMAAMARVENPDKVVYRSDMDTYVLDLMRARTMEQLMHYASMSDSPLLPKNCLMRCEGHWDQVPTTHIHRGCVLWMGDCEDNEVKRPEEYQTVRLQGVKIGGVLPVHDLTVLLGPENVKKLRVGSKMFSEGSTFLLGGPHSTRLQMKLWKLQGYLTSYKTENWMWTGN